MLYLLDSIFNSFYLCNMAYLFTQKGQVSDECSVQEDDTCSAVKGARVTVAIPTEGYTTD